MAVIISINITWVYAGTILPEEQVDKYLYNIAYYEQSYITNPTFASVGGEWAVMGLARYGAITDEFINTYKSNLKNCLDSCKGVLSERKYTEYARVVIALTALEENPENFYGYNLLKPLAEFDNVMKLDCGEYEVPKADSNYNGKITTREKLKAVLLGSQKEDGGWSIGGNKADTDMTAMVIQALEPYYDKEEKVKKAVNEGFEALSKLQQKDGSFASGQTKNCESTAQVLTAMAVINVDIGNKVFVKNGNTIIEGLMQYYKDGGFCHQLGQDVDQMATEQAMYALTAYYRSISGKNGLFEMKDGMTRKSIKIENLNSGVEVEKKTSFNSNAENKKESKTKKVKKNKITKYEVTTKDVKMVEETTFVNETIKKEIDKNTIVTKTKEHRETIGKVVDEESSLIQQERNDSDNKHNNREFIVIGILAVILILGAMGVKYYITKNSGDKNEKS